MREYFRPLVRHGLPRPPEALPVAGGPGWFTEALRHRRDAAPEPVPAAAIPQEALDRLTAPRPALAGLVFDRPRLMGILNVTPDSFSDGGQHVTAARALAHARQMVQEGADLVDVGGESTRPGAETVPAEAEIARVEPVIRALAHELPVPISIDTRKSCVADRAVAAGAGLINDVSGFTYDRMLAPFCARSELPICIMHAQGDPETMQEDPRYDDPLLDVYDFLEGQVVMLEGLGIPRARMIVDPGIGFGKRVPHNLALLNGLSIFHGLGCAILLGASRKGFIRSLTGAEPASARMPGSVAAALAGVAQGVQILRVHDVGETAQALTVWRAIQQGEQVQ
ncbi:dihydropteroate synthase [Pseudoponticoccus marisrubri]|uniref:Dihydropteroate synthase n=1 Tax=Pseudoponticoccus marisrubri TaxID=1685382 RepID=A0A0W7WN64_9RHOB|nr:dihydropteroate synthase [Pseudoponticoccus marisrubri]KUF12015.1 dihydropteroate synthase [Pseudoponticoccus marisrubri]